MAAILETYKNVSGQKIDLSKSSIIFGMKIEHSVRGRI